jgi:hypothetical protein
MSRRDSFGQPVESIMEFAFQKILLAQSGQTSDLSAVALVGWVFSITGARAIPCHQSLESVVKYDEVNDRGNIVIVLA